MAKKKNLRIWLENLGIEVPVYKLHEADGQAEILMSDIPKDVAKKAGLSANQKTVVYWYGENAGGNHLIEPVAETKAVAKHERCGSRIVLTDEQKGANAVGLSCIMAKGHGGELHEAHLFSGSDAHTIQWKAN